MGLSAMAMSAGAALTRNFIEWEEMARATVSKEVCFTPIFLLTCLSVQLPDLMGWMALVLWVTLRKIKS